LQVALEDTNFLDCSNETVWSFFPGSDGPGPGQYDPFKDPGIRAPIDLVNEHKPLQSTVLMVSFWILYMLVYLGLQHFKQKNNNLVEIISRLLKRTGSNPLNLR